MQNYWDRPFKNFRYARAVESSAANSNQEYPFKEIDDDFSGGAKLIGVSVRIPATNARTKDKNLLVTANVFNGSVLVLKSTEEKRRIELPFSTIAERSGGDNFFMRLPEYMKPTDLNTSKSFILNEASTAHTDAAATALEYYEVVFWYLDDANC